MSKPIVNTAKILVALALCSCAFRPGYAQSVTPPAQKEIFSPAENIQRPLIDFLNWLEAIHPVRFAYQKKYLVGKYMAGEFTLNGSLEESLGTALAPHRLNFRRIENIDDVIYVIVPMKPEEGEVIPTQNARNRTRVRTVTGTVRDHKDGSLLPGVNVILNGTRTGTITDVNGSFTLDIPDDSRGVLSFSYVGFATLELPVFHENVLQIELTEDPRQLSEVVITALGIGREYKSLGYSVNTLTADQLTATGNTNFASALYGKAPGVRIRTSPGGATSAVSIQIRGLNSLNYNTQPLYIIDGVLLRDANEKGASGVNNADYYTDPRIRGNGILDVNPADIETLTVLKGASATALYGSDASSGVVVITTRGGTKKTGLGIEVNYSFNLDKVAFTPKFQNIYGPGYDRERNVALGATPEGWVPVDTDNDGEANGVRPLFESYAQFGPRMEGQEVFWWDGNIRNYVPQPDNYRNFYRTGFNSLFNVAFSDHLEKFRYRFSFTRNDNEGIQVGGNLERNTFSLNSTLQMNEKVSLDFVVHYMNSAIRNRPMRINRLMASWSGFYSRAEDMSLFFEKYKTSQGYKWVPFDQAQRNPDEALVYTTPRGYEVMNFLWGQLRNSEDELQNRLITSTTINYQITKKLTFRGRVGSDLTNLDVETKKYNEHPTVFNQNGSTGEYAISNGRYSIFYSDALLTYSGNASGNIKFSLQSGFQLRDEKYKDELRSTNGGLVEANWFNLINSYNANLITREATSSILKYAFLGLANISYKDYLFFGATGRQEYSSTLPPSNNRYFYPSLNSSFIFSEAVALPAFINFGKLRGSFGVVGNAPPAYEANRIYTLSSLQTINGTVISGSSVGGLSGNDKIRPEQKYELEAGVEGKFFNSKLGVDITYYTSQTRNQILQLDLPSSTGADRILTNIGELRSNGWELGLSSTPLSGKFTWNVMLSAGVNKTMVQKLTPGLDQLVFREFEGSAIKVVAEVGESIGNIYVYPRKQNADGNYIISNEGLYVIDKTRYSKAGNLLPQSVGGLTNTFLYKNLSLELVMDGSFGGKIISPPLKYGTAAGLYKSTLQFRDAEHGGLPYYIDAGGVKTLLPNHQSNAPNGEMVYHDGVLLTGVTEEGLPNTRVIDAATYYLNTFDWGNNAWNEKGAIYDNDYIKLREAVLTYRIPDNWSRKFHVQNIQVSLFARNLFYIWRTLENLDPEFAIGTNWLNQGVDDGSSAVTRSYGFRINMNF